MHLGRLIGRLWLSAEVAYAVAVLAGPDPTVTSTGDVEVWPDAAVLHWLGMFLAVVVTAAVAVGAAVGASLRRRRRPQDHHRPVQRARTVDLSG
jgi:hypothetical protein